MNFFNPKSKVTRSKKKGSFREKIKVPKILDETVKINRKSTSRPSAIQLNEEITLKKEDNTENYPIIMKSKTFKSKKNKSMNFMSSNFNTFMSEVENRKQKNRTKLMKKKLKLSCDLIGKNCNLLRNTVYGEYHQKDNKFLSIQNDLTMDTIRDDFINTRKEIDKKGVFLLMPKRSSSLKKQNGDYRLNRIENFLSFDSNNIFSQSKVCDEVNPITAFKLKNKFNQEFNLGLNKRAKSKLASKSAKTSYNDFLVAYNREIYYKKQIENKFNIKNDKDDNGFLFTL